MSRRRQAKYVECRTLKHAWDPNDATAPKGYNLALLCVRCTTERYDSLVAGELKRRRYKYPPDYLYTAAEKPSNQQLRMDLMRKIRNGTTQQLRAS